MIRFIAVALPLLLVAGCGGGSDNTQDAPVTTEPTPTTVLDTTPPPGTTATTEAVVIEGADSSEDAVSEWYDGIADSDLSGMWSIIDPELKTGVKRSEWDACIGAQFDEMSIDSIDYDEAEAEAEAYTEDGAVFSTGAGTVKAGDQEVKQPVTFEVVEREGGWFAVGPVISSNEESCLEQSAG